MTLTIKPLPPELTEVLFELGGRKLLLVEGLSDVEILEEWYSERLPYIDFYAAGGYQMVAMLLKDLHAQRPDVAAYGLRDRAFLSDQEVSESLEHPSSRLFILRRYSIENYLLEPAALQIEMRTFLGKACLIKSAPAMEAEILKLCRQLGTMMAANWVLIEKGQDKFTEGHNIEDRKYFIAAAAARIGCSEAEAGKLIADKEALIVPVLETLDTAHARISGKHLLHQVYNLVAQIRRGLHKDHLRRLLCNRIKGTGGLPQDITTIVEQRILGRQPH